MDLPSCFNAFNLSLKCSAVDVSTQLQKRQLQRNPFENFRFISNVTSIFNNYDAGGQNFYISCFE
jgi:hypothetical protein